MTKVWEMTSKLRPSAGGKMHGPVGPAPAPRSEVGGGRWGTHRTSADISAMLERVHRGLDEQNFERIQEKPKAVNRLLRMRKNKIGDLEHELADVRDKLEVLSLEKAPDALVLLRRVAASMGFRVDQHPYAPSYELVDDQNRAAAHVSHQVLHAGTWTMEGIRSALDIIPEEKRSESRTALVDLYAQFFGLVITKLGLQKETEGYELGHVLDVVGGTLEGLMQESEALADRKKKPYSPPAMALRSDSRTFAEEVDRLYAEGKQHLLAKLPPSEHQEPDDVPPSKLSFDHTPCCPEKWEAPEGADPRGLYVPGTHDGTINLTGRYED